jgi:hypothetical protein
MCWIRYRVTPEAFAELFDGAFMADDVTEQFFALIDSLLMVLSACRLDGEEPRLSCDNQLGSASHGVEVAAVLGPRCRV